MTAFTQVLLTAFAYVATGMALVGYDMAAPPLERKVYVVRKDLRVAFITWFAWPTTVVFDVIQEYRMRGPYLRLAGGVACLAVTIFLWARVAFLTASWAIGITWLAFLVTAIAMLAACPILTGIAMPQHARPHSR